MSVPVEPVPDDRSGIDRDGPAAGPDGRGRRVVRRESAAGNETMSEPFTYDVDVFENALGSAVSLQRLPALARYTLALFLVVAATVMAAAVQSFVSAANVALIYVLPVVVTASYCGWGASLFAVALSVLAFDFFFTVPYYSLAIADPAEIWATALLFVIATIVASVAADARRRTLDATEAAEKAAALQTLAHAVVHARTPDAVMQSAAATLHRLFRAPSIIYVRRGKGLDVAARAGGARDTDEEREAALGALSAGQGTRGDTYPFDRARLDFWPVSTGAGHCVLGVDFARAERERPEATEQLIESVAGYVTAALDRAEARTAARAD